MNRSKKSFFRKRVPMNSLPAGVLALLIIVIFRVKEFDAFCIRRFAEIFLSVEVVLL